VSEGEGKLHPRTGSVRADALVCPHGRAIFVRMLLCVHPSAWMGCIHADAFFRPRRRLRLHGRGFLSAWTGSVRADALVCRHGRVHPSARTGDACVEGFLLSVGKTLSVG
jgi:hypothetical protein